MTLEQKEEHVKVRKWGLFPALLIALVLTACGPSHLKAAAASASARATSSTAQADKNAAKAGADAVLPAKYQTPAGLIGLAFHKSERQALAQQLRIPKATAAHPDIPGVSNNRTLFEQALANAAYTAYKQGAFKKTRDATQQAAHVKFIAVIFPTLVKQYQ
jgi:hypothetical protein